LEQRPPICCSSSQFCLEVAFSEDVEGINYDAVVQGRSLFSLQRKIAMAKKSSSKTTSSTGKARSAVTGRYVTKGYAKKHPKTTVVEKK
jgi:hypothetical protein